MIQDDRVTNNRKECLIHAPLTYISSSWTLCPGFKIKHDVKNTVLVEFKWTWILALFIKVLVGSYLYKA